MLMKSKLVCCGKTNKMKGNNLYVHSVCIIPPLELLHYGLLLRVRPTFSWLSFHHHINKNKLHEHTRPETVLISRAPYDFGHKFSLSCATVFDQEKLTECFPLLSPQKPIINTLVCSFRFLVRANARLVSAFAAAPRRMRCPTGGQTAEPRKKATEFIAFANANDT